MKTTRAISFLCLLGLWLPSGAQTVNLRPGNYETTAEMSMPGSSVKPQPITGAACITTQDLNKFVPRLATKDQNCTLSDYNLTGAKATFTRSCRGEGGAMITRGELTFASDSFNGVLETKSGGGRTFTMRLTGKRIGECTK